MWKACSQRAFRMEGSATLSHVSKVTAICTRPSHKKAATINSHVEFRSLHTVREPPSVARRMVHEQLIIQGVFHYTRLLQKHVLPLCLLCDDELQRGSKCLPENAFLSSNVLETILHRCTSKKNLSVSFQASRGNHIAGIESNLLSANDFMTV